MDYVVEIRSTCYVLHNYFPGMNQRLEKTFSVYDKVRHKYSAFAIIYDAVNKDLYVPRGTNLGLILPSFRNEQIIRTPPDHAMDVGPIKLKARPRDERQMEAISFMVGLGKYSSNRECTQLCLNLPTGVGKTFVAVFAMSYIALKTAVVTSNKSWLLQWKECICRYTDIKEKDVYMIDGTGSIRTLLRGIHDHRTIKVFLITHSTLTYYAKKKGLGAIRELFISLKIGINIIDESHLQFESSIRISAATNVAKTFYLTATPMKSDFFQNKIYQKSFENVPKISLYDEETDNHVSYLAIRFNSRPSAYDMARIASGSYGFNIQAYVKYFIRRPTFYSMLQIVMVHCLSEMSPGDRMMMYFASIEAIQMAERWLRFHFWKLSLGLYCSLVSKEKKHDELKATCILTTTKSAQALLDIKNLKKVVIFAEPFNSEPIAIQVMGRLRDPETEMIELVDCGFSRIYEWYRNKVSKVYGKYATEINELTYSENEIREAILMMERNDHERMLANRPNLKEIVYRE